MLLGINGLRRSGRVLRNPALPSVGWTLVADVNPMVSMWQDAARTTIAKNDGDPVGSIRYAVDKYLSTATAGDRPLLKKGVLNGYPALVFDGVDDALFDSTFSIANPFTMFMVVKVVGTQELILDSTSGSTDRFYLNTPSLSNGFEANGVGVRYQSPGKWVLIEVVRNGASSIITINGFPTSGNMGTGNWAGLRLGEHATTGGLNFEGSVGRMLIGTGAMSLADRQTMRYFLANHYKIKVWPHISLLGATMTLDLAVTESGIRVVDNESWFEQSASSTYMRMAGVSVVGKRIIGAVKIMANLATGAVGPWTANEAKHAGIQFLATNADNNYILMISPAASAAGERSIQLVKQVSAVETVLATGIASELLELNTEYLLEGYKSGNNVTGTVRKLDGTSLGQVNAVDTSLTTGNCGTHGFATTQRFRPLRIEDI